MTLPARNAIHAMLSRQIVDLWSEGQLAIVDAMYAEDCIDHMPVPGQAGGRPGLKHAVEIFRAAMPDLRLRLAHTLAVGTPQAGWGVDVWRLTGTHTGAPLFGLPASGRAVAFAGIDWLRIAHGQVAELWHIEDMATMADQLGLTIPPAAAADITLPAEPLLPADLTPAESAVLAAARRHLQAGTSPLSDQLTTAAASAAAPDLAMHDAAWLVDGPLAACRRVITGTHSAASLCGLPARGRPFAIHAHAVLQISPAGTIADEWHVADIFGLRGQIAA